MSFWNIVNQVLREADLIIEVVDARYIEETRNIEIEQKVIRFQKKILYVINKADLATPEELEKAKKILHPSVFISSRDKLGTTILKRKILELSHGENVVVGILGYPNVGKSSLINALSGRSAAKTSPHSGLTKTLQKIKVDNKIVVLDTPGVLPLKEKNQSKHIQTGALSYEKVKDAETAALNLIENNFRKIKEFYAVEGEDTEDILENIALKLKKIRRGNLPDLEATSRILLKEWQTGKIK